MNKKLEVERKMCLIYPFNPNTAVVANFQRDLYLASLLGVKNVKFYPIYRDTKDSTIDKSIDIVDKLEKRLEYDKENTALLDKPDYRKINEFVASVNERVVKDAI